MEKNQKDWEELQIWEDSRKIEEKEKYGIELDKANTKSQKRINFISKGLNFIIKAIKKAGIVSVIIFAIIVIFIVNLVFTSINERSNFDVEELISKQYHQELIPILKEMDKRGNGKYIFACKDNPQIVFSAQKDKRSLKEDYLDNCHKYYFDKWDSDYKKDFIIDEKTVDGMLEYDMLFEINTDEDIERAVKEIKAFIASCDGHFSVAWDVFLVKGNYKTLFCDNEEKLLIDDEEMIKNIKERMPK